MPRRAEHRRSRPPAVTLSLFYLPVGLAGTTRTLALIFNEWHGHEGGASVQSYFFLAISAQSQNVAKVPRLISSERFALSSRGASGAVHAAPWLRAGVAAARSAEHLADALLVD